MRNDKMDDKNFQNSLCITSMKQKLSGPIKAHGPFIDIDGMLFEFFMNFLNIEKNKIFRNLFSIFHVFFTFYAISNI